jgi:hypothetical protein
MPSRLAKLVAHRRALAFTVVIGALLGLSTLGVGFYTDDFTFLADLETKSPKQPSPFGLYDFSRGGAETVALMARGPFPWWTDPSLKLRFLRPLSSELFRLDHALFGHAPLGYHVHAWIWFVLYLAGVALLYRAVLGPTLAVVCSLVFALTASHFEPLGWISSRHLLVSCTPALWGLVAHIAFREHGFRPGRWLSVLGLLVGLLGGESALGLGLFWIAYELLGAPRPGDGRAKLGGVAVPSSVLAAYLLVYKLGDFGSAHNGAYFEPLSDPMGFLGAAALRTPALLGEIFFGIPSELIAVFAPGPFVVAGIVVTAIVVALFASVRSAIPASDRRSIAWLTLGAFGALAIAVGGFPGARLLLAPSIGGSAVIGAILCYGWKPLAEPAAVFFPRRAGFVLLVLVHIVLAPLAFLNGALLFAKLGAQTQRIDESLDAFLPAPGSAPATPPSVFLVASDPLAGIYVGAAHAVRSPGTASGWSMLSMARATHDIHRPDDRTLVIDVDRPMLHGSFEQVFDDPARVPWVVGQRVALEEMTVTVLAVDRGFPTRIEARFVAPLEDDRFRFLAWQNGKLLPLRVSIGDHIVIPWTPGPVGFF